MNHEVKHPKTVRDKQKECPFCTYPVVSLDQQTCTECGERVDGDAPWMRRREWELIWDRYRWVLILGVLVVTSIATLVVNNLVTENWLLMKVAGVVAVSILLGMFIKYSRAQVLALVLISGVLIYSLWGVNRDYYLVAILLSGYLWGSLVITGVICGVALRYVCWWQVRWDLGHFKHVRTPTLEQKECPFCTYPLISLDQQMCTECGERVDGDAAWMHTREMELVWKHYRWILILGVLGLTTVIGVIAYPRAPDGRSLEVHVGIIAVSMVLGMFFRYRLAQVLATTLTLTYMTVFLWGMNMDYIITGLIGGGFVSSGLVLGSAVIGMFLREKCFSQCKRDLGGKG